MDMTDNELLEQLFQPMKEMQLADDGFTDRVMKQLPQRDVWRLSRLWTVFCVVVAVVLFVLLRGWEIIAHGLLMFANTPPTSQQMLTFAVSVGIVGLLALSEVLGRVRCGAF